MRRSKVEVTAPDWGDTSRAGTLVRIRGERGTYSVKHEAGPDDPGGEHVCIFGGPHTQTRHIRPDQIIWPRKRRSA